MEKAGDNMLPITDSECAGGTAPVALVTGHIGENEKNQGWAKTADKAVKPLDPPESMPLDN